MRKMRQGSRARWMRWGRRQKPGSMRFGLVALKARLAHEQRMVDGDMPEAESLLILEWDLDDARSQLRSLVAVYGDSK
jgi:hypothetical protein